MARSFSEREKENLEMERYHEEVHCWIRGSII